jgi:hypothetical protein
MYISIKRAAPEKVRIARCMRAARNSLQYADGALRHRFAITQGFFASSNSPESIFEYAHEAPILAAVCRSHWSKDKHEQARRGYGQARKERSGRAWSGSRNTLQSYASPDEAKPPASSPYPPRYNDPLKVERSETMGGRYRGLGVRGRGSRKGGGIHAGPLRQKSRLTS